MGSLLFRVAVGELVKTGAVVGFDEVSEFVHDDRINHQSGKLAMRSVMRISPAVGEHDPHRLRWLVTQRIEEGVGSR